VDLIGEQESPVAPNPAWLIPEAILVAQEFHNFGGELLRQIKPVQTPVGR